MEKRLEYYCRKINKSIDANNKSDAETYHQKALKNIGNNEEILAFKSRIDKMKTPASINQEALSENSKAVKSNEGIITLIAVLTATVVLIVYFSVSIFPKYSLYRKLNRTWYVGDVSSSNADGLVLEFEFGEKYTFKLKYRHWNDLSYFPIAEFNGGILNGNEITVDEQVIKVEFDKEGEIVSFSPSFVSVEEKSTWKKYDIGIGGNDYFEGSDFITSKKQ